MSNKPATEAARARELIVFRIGDQEFCVDIMSVREIRGWMPATVLPRSPSYVRGVINLRGTVLPIVDLAARLEYPPAIPTTRHVIVVTQIANQVIGLLVDAVSDILTFDETQIQPTPPVASESARSFVGGLIALEGRMINLLRLDNILSEMRVEAA